MEVIPNHWTKSWDDPPSGGHIDLPKSESLRNGAILFAVWLIIACAPQLFKLDHQPTNQQTTSGAQFLHSSLPPKKGELKISDDRRRSDHKDYCNLSDPGSLLMFPFLCCWNGDQPKLWWFYLLSRFICALVLPDNWFVSAHLKFQTDRVVCWEIPMKVQDIYYSYHIQPTFCFSHTHRYEQKYPVYNSPVCIKYP